MHEMKRQGMGKGEMTAMSESANTSGGQIHSEHRNYILCLLQWLWELGKSEM